MDEVRLNNRRRILTELALNGPSSRTRLGRITGLTGASISRIIRTLIDDELVCEGEVRVARAGAGRRPTCLSINPAGGFLLGITMNAFRQAVVLVDLANEVVARQDLSVSHSDSARTILDTAVAAVDALMSEHAVAHDRLLGCVFTAAGSVDPSEGVVHAPTTIGWRHVDVGEFLTGRLGVPVRVERIPNAMLLSETRVGLARGARNALLLNASLGIGAALCLDGQLIRGSGFRAGVIDGLRLRSADGRIQPLETVAAGWAAMRALGESSALDDPGCSFYADVKRLYEVMARANAHDAEAERAFRQAGTALGEVARIASDCLGLDRIIISGPLARVPVYVNAVRKTILDVGGDGDAPDLALPTVVESLISSEEAARWLGVFEFVCTAEHTAGRAGGAAFAG